MKNRNFLAALVAFVVLALTGCGGKESPFDGAISCLVIGLAVAGLLASISFRFLKKHRGSATAFSAFVILALTGCAGGGASSATTQPFSGTFAGGSIFLNPDRGGGPSISIEATEVLCTDGRFEADCQLFLTGETVVGGNLIGYISKSGMLTATIDLTDGGKLSIGGGPLRWEASRGGPDKTLRGAVAVVYRPVGGEEIKYLASTIELWQ